MFIHPQNLLRTITFLRSFSARFFCFSPKHQITKGMTESFATITKSTGSKSQAAAATVAEAEAIPPKLFVVEDNRGGPAATMWQWLMGGLCFSTFILSWVLSLASPMLLILSLYCHSWLATSVIAILTTLAYLPWSPNPVPAFQTMFLHYTRYYFRSLRIVFEGQNIPTSVTDNKDSTARDSTVVKNKQDEQDDYDDDKVRRAPTLLAVHPHGIFSLGWSMLVLRLHHVHFCFAHSLYLSPFFRLFARLTGNPESANKGAMQAAMRKGRHLALIPGGLEEATITSGSAERVYIKKRFGFVKLCLQYGYQLRPVYSFGEIEAFDNLQGLFPFRLWMNRYGIPGAIPWGWLPIPFLPKPNVDLMVVVGPILKLPMIADPTFEDVQNWHARYIEALQDLFERHKVEAYGPDIGKNKTLELW